MTYKNHLRSPFILIAWFASLACAQWLNYPAPGTPRLPNGKPNLAAPAPRGSNGRPDLSGVWHVDPTPVAEMRRLFPELVKTAEATGVPSMDVGTVSKYAANILVDFNAKEPPLRADVQLRRGSGGSCLPAGIPLAFLLSDPNKIIQAPGVIVIMYESDGTHRQSILMAGLFQKIHSRPGWGIQRLSGKATRW